MRAHRITSNGEAVPASRLAPTDRSVGRPAASARPGSARFAGCRAVALAIALAAPAGAAAGHVAAVSPASGPGVAGDGASWHPAPIPVAAGPGDDPAGHAAELPEPAPPPDIAAVPASPGRVAAPLGSAAGMLPPARAKARRRHAAEPMPGCTGMATLDGVSAALQAGPFGRGKGLAIMQFRNVVTDSEEDGRVACHSDVLLSDGSLHRADYGLRRVRRGTRLHIEVADEREDIAPADLPAQASPVPPDAGAPVPAPGAPGVHVPGT
ncbi:MAG: hypothetical protein ACRYGC_00405 [Janthinobacterium lividum]